MSANSKISRAILAPIVSEKSTMVGEKNNVITLWVRPDATKGQIKAAAEKYFDVKVKSVSTLRMKAKEVTFGQQKGMSKQRKKAYVTLAEGSTYDFEASQQG